MTVKLGITLAVVALVTSGTGCGKQKPESGTVEATKDSTSAAAVRDTSTNATNASLQWGPAPAVFPAGAKMAVVSGDPSKAEPFVVELSMPNGYKVPPHFHPTDEVVEVKEGTFLVGMGDTFDPKKTSPMKQGDKATVPANKHHFGLARGATIVAVSANGPFALTYVHPADDPRNKPSTP
jgi:quercetin dioxygenase-like cupin family protein